MWKLWNWRVIRYESWMVDHDWPEYFREFGVQCLRLVHGQLDGLTCDGEFDLRIHTLRVYLLEVVCGGKHLARFTFVHQN